MATRYGHWQLGILSVPALAIAAVLAVAAVYWFKPLLLLDVHAAWMRARAGLSPPDARIDGDR